MHRNITTIHTRLLSLFIVCFCLHLQHGNAVELELWDGSKETGAITYRRGSFKVTKKSSAKQINIKDVFEARFSSEASKTEHLDRITLTDGSKINAKIGVSSDFASIPVELANGTEIEIAGEMIQEIEFAELDAGASVVGNPPGQYCISRNGKTLTCEIEWISKFDISIKRKAGRMKLNRERIHKVGFSRKPISPVSGTDVVIKTRYNDTLYGKLVLIEDGNLQINHKLGRLSYRNSEIRSIISYSQNIVSLADIKVENIKQTPYFDHIKDLRINRNLFGGPLYLNGVRFDKGLSMHSRSSAQFKLGGTYKRLLVNIGLDTSITELGHAVFIIKGDGKTLSSSQLGGKDPAQLLSIDVNGINTLTLMLDYGKNGNSGDHGIWGNPRLIK